MSVPELVSQRLPALPYSTQCSWRSKVFWRVQKWNSSDLESETVTGLNVRYSNFQTASRPMWFRSLISHPPTPPLSPLLLVIIFPREWPRTGPWNWESNERVKMIILPSNQSLRGTGTRPPMQLLHKFDYAWAAFTSPHLASFISFSYRSTGGFEHHP